MKWLKILKLIVDSGYRYGIEAEYIFVCRFGNIQRINERGVDLDQPDAGDTERTVLQVCEYVYFPDRHRVRHRALLCGLLPRLSPFS